MQPQHPSASEWVRHSSAPRRFVHFGTPGLAAGDPTGAGGSGNGVRCGAVRQAASYPVSRLIGALDEDDRPKATLVPIGLKKLCLNRVTPPYQPADAPDTVPTLHLRVGLAACTDSAVGPPLIRRVAHIRCRQSCAE